MAGMGCQCGEILKNTVYPNEIEWYIYKKEDWEKLQSELFEVTQDQEDFDSFWLCPKCKRAHVWLNTNRKHEETRTYEYRKINNNISVDISKFKELYLLSVKDEDYYLDVYITIKQLMTDYPHNHRYFITDDEKTLYLYNVKEQKIDGKYILTYLSTN